MSGFKGHPLPAPEDEAFDLELRAAPWGYGQRRQPTFLEILERMRRAGLGEEADWMAREYAIRAESAERP